MSEGYFKHCSICKKPIDFGGGYYRCSVSTCNRKRMELFFCSVPCWDAHVPEARHRDAWAEPAQAPSHAEHERQMRAAGDAPNEQTVHTAQPAHSDTRRRIVGGADSDSEALPRDVLVVVSKLKKFIRAKSGMNTSDNVTEVLSEHLRQLCVQAIRHAAESDRKTVMDRDFTAALGRRPDQR